MGGNGSSSQKPGKGSTSVDYTKVHAVYGNMTDNEINSFMSANVDSYISKATSNWKQDDKDRYSGIVKSAFNEVKDSEMKVAYGKLIQSEHLHLELNNTKNTSTYTHDTKTVLLSRKTLNVSDVDAKAVVMHEFGHALDAHLSHVSETPTNVSNYNEEGRKVYSTFLAKSDPSFNKAISLNNVKNIGIQDIVSGATTNKVETSYQHSNAYWKKNKYNGVAEAFANISEIKSNGNKESLGYLEKYFSRTLDAHTNAVDDFINS